MTKPAAHTALWLSVPLLLLLSYLLVQGLGSLALWQDEAFSITSSQQASFRAILDFTEGDNHPPLFPFTLHLWRQVAGGELPALRSWGLFASILALVLTYRLALDLFNLRAALVALLMLGTSDLFLGLGASARQYSWYVLFGLLSTWAYWRYQRRWQWAWGLAYVVSAAALLYTLYWGAFILIAHGLHLLLTRPRQVLRLLLPALIIGVLFLPWLPQVFASLTGGYSIEATGHEAALPVNRYGLGIISFQLFGVPEAVFMVLALAGLVGSFQQRRYLPSSQSLLAGLYLGIPVLIPILATLGGYGLLVHRPMVGMIPALALLLGHILSQLRPWTYHLLLAILLLNNLTTQGADYRPRGPWQEVAATMQAYVAPGDAILVEADLHVYAVERHAEWAGVPLNNFIRAQQLRLGLWGEQQGDVLAQVQPHEVVWLLLLGDDYDWRGDLAALGYQQTTPEFHYAPYLGIESRLMRFARPPQGEALATFGDTLALHELEAFVVEGSLHVNLLWQATQPPGLDYSVSVFLLAGDGRLVAQHDSYPLENKAPTSAWEPGRFYFDGHQLSVAGLASGEYTLAVRVYTWWDQAIQPAMPCTAPDCSYFPAETLSLR